MLVTSLVALLTIALFCVMSWGRFSAERQRSFQLIDDKYIVIRKYDDTIIMAGFDKYTGRTTGKYKYVKLDKEIEFSRIQLSKLEIR